MTEQPTEADFEKAASDFFENKKIVIVDHSPACREGVKGVLLDYGVYDNQVKTFSRFDEAQQYIEAEKPSVIMTEFAFKEDSALELIPVVNSYLKSQLDKLFVIVTNNATETAVAEAAEEDVDAYVLKPFSRLYLREYLAKTIYPKLYPSDYTKTIELGKSHLKSGEFDPAQLMFTKAKTLSDNPSLAHYYLGKVEEARENMDGALEQYVAGLEFNPLHYRCLSARFNALEKMKKMEEAYAIAQKLVAHYPMSADRLGKVIQLAVFTHHFADVQKYFDVFKKLQNRPESLVKTVQAALYVCGKFLVQKGMEESALKAFRDAIVTSEYDLSLIEKSVRFLLENSMPGGSENVLRLFPMEKRTETSFQVLELLVSAQTDPPERFTNKAKDKIKEGLSSPEIYLCLAQSLKAMEDERGCQNTLYEAIEKFPDQAEMFKKKLG